MHLNSNSYVGKMREARQLRKSAEEYRSKGDYAHAWELEVLADETEDTVEAEE